MHSCHFVHLCVMMIGIRNGILCKDWSKLHSIVGMYCILCGRWGVGMYNIPCSIECTLYKEHVMHTVWYSM